MKGTMEKEMRSKKPILLVEDDRIDCMTVTRALKEINVTNQLEIANNGEEALAFLRNGNNTRPCIILLDLNMPRMNGLEFVKVARQEDLLRGIPVVVLTTSKDEHDRVESFDLNVAGYMVKPVDYRKFVETMKTINMYWTLSELP